MSKPDGAAFPAVFTHPSAGKVTLDQQRIAIRWRPGADDAAREAVLEQAGLRPVQADAQRPSLAVNRTDGLWWARSAKGDAVADDVLARLEAEEIIEWVSPAYR